MLRDTFTRNFGVWREANEGNSVVFDPLFEKGTPLPGPGEQPLYVSRRYRPVHNIGHFRYLECSHRASDDRPAGDIMVWDEILFPFDQLLEREQELTGIGINQCSHLNDQDIEEAYACDSGGAVTVTISNITAGYKRTYRLGRWTVPSTPITPGKRRRRRAQKTTHK